MSAPTISEHLTYFLSDPLFRDLTGLHKGIGGHIVCDLCKSTVGNE